MSEFALQLQSLRKSFGGLCVTDAVTMDIRMGELHAIIGPNGAGKTTLINQISGLVPPDSGRIILIGQDVTDLPIHKRASLGLARSFQVNSILPGFTVLENVALAVQVRCGSSFSFLKPASNERKLNDDAMATLDELGMSDRASSIAGKLSHGEKRALELAMALAMQPQLLLLDEPMAGSGPRESEILIDLLLRLKGRFSMILVEHDMNAVFTLADRVSVLIYGRVLSSGLPNDVRSDPQVVSAYLGDE